MDYVSAAKILIFIIKSKQISKKCLKFANIRNKNAKIFANNGKNVYICSVNNKKNVSSIMSFNGTKTPTKPKDNSQQIYVVPYYNIKGGGKKQYLTPALEEQFRRLYPVMMNADLMAIFGLCFSTLQRFKRELGLKKDDRIIKKKHAAQVKRIFRENGYYKSIKGKAPSKEAAE